MDETLDDKLFLHMKLEILDEIDAGLKRTVYHKVDVADERRRWAFQFLVDGDYVTRPSYAPEDVGHYEPKTSELWDVCSGITPKGQKLRLELRDQYRRDNEQRQTNAYVKYTLGWAIATFVMVIVLHFFFR